ncbi:MAG: hypothetical protein C4574_01825 [Candidatus Latescibacterota bacterium]|jgi:hypothetical protein|nr:MAG: hypothetical protein C4574_01825 [Candidatus Latescibacterota bacterium]
MNRKALVRAAAFACVLSTAAAAHGRDNNEAWAEKMKDAGKRIWVLDGSPVHNVGNLQMHVTNWGAIGSYPSSRFPTAEAPSAQWPANSGVEYLYIAGLWVGAKKNGIPVVTTAAYDIEFRPHPTDPLARIYRSFEGAPGGARYPSPPDDDKDGLINEDWLNGVDDDGDGQIDEDFAAIGKQMFSCWFTDFDPTSIQANPEHTPLNLFVRQESYQWEEEKFFNFVGLEYKIKNVGTEAIEDLYIGFFADGDAGPRTREQYWLDDGTGLFEGIVCAQRGDNVVPIRISSAYFYDIDGDEGATPGYFGVLFLGHDTDPLGEMAPKQVGITSYQNFSGDQPYENGGDPTNDFQRYELMSKNAKDRNQEVPRDYRMLLATGPFRELPPDSQLVLQVAFCCGNGLEGMKTAAASAALTYSGNWFDIDGNPLSGVNGRETPVYGPAMSVEPDSCDADAEVLSAARGEVIWINADCRRELELWNDVTCSKGNASFTDYQTGVNGKETQVFWLVGSAPPPPTMRLLTGDRKVTLLWDNFSEVTPDVSTLEYDFEGYRIWRADGWDRPYGTSVLTGPPRDLWQLLEERDLINGVAPDIEFKKPFSEGGWEYEPLVELGAEKDRILAYFEESVYYYPMDDVPCPPGLSALECDTLEALARYSLGFEGGLKYYKYIDNSVHNGMHYFYSVTAYDHVLSGGVPRRVGYFGDPSSNFQYITPLSDAQKSVAFEEKEVYVVPNPATTRTMEPWQLFPNQDDPTGIKVEFRNLPRCRSTIRIYTVAGDLVEVIYHDGSGGNGTAPWDLVSRNGQDVTSGVYLFAVEPEDGSFQRAIGKFVVIR